MYQDKKSTCNIRTGNLRKYQDRKSTGNIRTVNVHDIRTGNLQAISWQKIYMIYQDRKSTGNIRIGNLHVISGQ